jgi:DNA repair exonuclease SbcCD ATPase subunit
MTDQELRDLVASFGVNLERMRQSADERQREYEERQRQADERAREADERQRQADERAREADERQRQADEQTRALKEAQQDAAKQIKELGRQIGGLGNKFGSFTESLALPSAEHLLDERFGIDAFAKYLRRRVKGESIELDGLGFSNGERNEAYLVEVKSRLDNRAVEQTLEMMERFHSYFPEFADKTLYGMIAAADATDEAIALAHRQGLYVIRFHDELMEFVEPANFMPRVILPKRDSLQA